MEKGDSNDVSVFIEADSSETLNANQIIGPRGQTFLYGKCQLFLAVFKWFPVIFIFAILGWGYYAYVIQLCIMTIESVWLQVPFVAVFNFLYVMCIWSYLQTIFTKPRSVPKEYWLTHAEYNKLVNEPTDEAKNALLFQIASQKGLPLSCRTFAGALRLCTKCNLIKPDRAHHCSVCNACVLKMDHHCPWVNNCVSFANYKYFILFLGYSFSMCLWAAGSSFNYFLKFWANQLPSFIKFNILFLFFVSAMFCISLFSLFSYHVYLVLVNRSTLESFSPPLFAYGPNKNAFNLGRLRNFKQVFGKQRLFWFFPVYTSVGEGVCYPSGEAHSIQLQQTMPVQPSPLDAPGSALVGLAHPQQGNPQKESVTINGMS